jgi:hypothetical protein
VPLGSGKHPTGLIARSSSDCAANGTKHKSKWLFPVHGVRGWHAPYRLPGSFCLVQSGAPGAGGREGVGLKASACRRGGPIYKAMARSERRSITLLAAPVCLTRWGSPRQGGQGGAARGNSTGSWESAGVGPESEFRSEHAHLTQRSADISETPIRDTDGYCRQHWISQGDRAR